MAQYFIAVNKTKKEYFNGDEVGGYSALGLWCASKAAGVMLFLLRKSDGKLFGRADEWGTGKTYAGRWADDKVSVVGDYDGSKLYAKAQKSYRNIAKGLVREYNEYMGDNTQWHLKYRRPDSLSE